MSTFAAFIAVCAILPGIPTPSGVPITLQTFAVILAGLVLGWRRGGLAALLYVVLGLAGLPDLLRRRRRGRGARRAVRRLPPRVPLRRRARRGPCRVGAAHRRAARSSSLADRLAARSGDGVGRAPSAWRYPLLVVAGLGASFLTIHPAGIVGLMVRLGITLPEAFAIDVVYWTGTTCRRTSPPPRSPSRSSRRSPTCCARAADLDDRARPDVLVRPTAPYPAGGADRVVRLLGSATLELVEHRVAIVGANGSGKSTLAPAPQRPRPAVVRHRPRGRPGHGAGRGRGAPQGRVHVHRPRRPAGHADARRGRRAVPAPPADDAGRAGRRRTRRAGPVRLWPTARRCPCTPSPGASGSCSHWRRCSRRSRRSSCATSRRRPSTCGGGASSTRSWRAWTSRSSS